MVIIIREQARSAARACAGVRHILCACVRVCVFAAGREPRKGALQRRSSLAPGGVQSSGGALHSHACARLCTQGWFNVQVVRRTKQGREEFSQWLKKQKADKTQ